GLWHVVYRITERQPRARGWPTVVVEHGAGDPPSGLKDEVDVGTAVRVERDRPTARRERRRPGPDEGLGGERDAADQKAPVQAAAGPTRRAVLREFRGPEVGRKPHPDDHQRPGDRAAVRGQDTAGDGQS